ncbi:MAG: hypothetical protein EA374_07735 [Acholeplasmatales bacterium]|nr:MAG: hypothetical protein EA374_07735 [Acholeplasmatales bacterium]
MRARAKVDLLFWVVLLIPIPAILWPMFLEETAGAQGILISAALLYGLFVLWLTLGSYYALEDAYLHIKILFIHQKIPYEQIASVRLAKNLLSSMALSVRRIEIKEKNKGALRGTTYIAPQDLEGFYEALKVRLPHLKEKKVDVDV